MNFWMLNRLLTTYVVLKAIVYAGCWAAVFLLLMLVASVSPKAALFIIKLAEPFSAVLHDLFWAFIPEPGQAVRAGARVFGWLGRKALTHTSDKTQLVVQLGILNGLVTVSFFAWVAHWFVMWPIKRKMLRKYFPK